MINPGQCCHRGVCWGTPHVAPNALAWHVKYEETASSKVCKAGGRLPTPLNMHVVFLSPSLAVGHLKGFRAIPAP